MCLKLVKLMSNRNRKIMFWEFDRIETQQSRQGAVMQQRILYFQKDSTGQQHRRQKQHISKQIGKDKKQLTDLTEMEKKMAETEKEHQC